MRTFPQTGGDTLVYGGIARNLLQNGRFAITDGSGVVHDTLIRLPGYPIFLAACFRLFGIDNYGAVAILQIFLELACCLLLADFVRRIASTRAGLNTLWLATMCPFIAAYACAPLTESLTFDMIAMALWSLERYRSSVSTRMNIRRRPLLFLAVFSFAVSAAAILRPDGALLAIALWPALLGMHTASYSRRRAWISACCCGLISLLPFALWTARNWATFHVLQPLAPRYANDPGEDPHLGWQRWVKTWCLDFACTSTVYWNVPDGPLDFNSLPRSWPNPVADSPRQWAETQQLVAEYNRDQELSPELDAHFAALARQRAREHPLRTEVLMPAARLADMLFRPRVENLTIDLEWWQYRLHRPETRFGWAYALLNVLYLGIGAAGFRFKPRYWQGMIAYMVLRCLLLATIEAPETRYTLELFPFFFCFGGIALWRLVRRKSPDRHAALVTDHLGTRRSL